MASSNKEINSYRYERKFNIPKHLGSYCLALIKSNSIILSEIFEERQVNSFYYDTYNLKFARQNINGNNNRKKIRLRYYGDQKILKDLTSNSNDHVGREKRRLAIISQKLELDREHYVLDAKGIEEERLELETSMKNECRS